MSITKTQAAFIYMGDNQDHTIASANVIRAKHGFFYADAIHCLNGDWSTGAFMDKKGRSAPALYLTRKEALDAHEEALKDFNDTEERDADDAYEGEVVAVKWHSDDRLEFFHLNENGIPYPESVGFTCARRAMGE
ncbi:hypothetical protein [Aliidiomarina quisquiliarum]|uniref:hypothetical protein n=1 Tax=Aliidiomarina quisquiliarum TaxID=2938947 RepID=UPI00208FC2F2|nr:hypothetical protein [Aliidiomarina quisquiliarum]MCO4319971.1 hypothetical protein [Aliidiomarina quisquiliarum]